MKVYWVTKVGEAASGCVTLPGHGMRRMLCSAARFAKKRKGHEVSRVDAVLLGHEMPRTASIRGSRYLLVYHAGLPRTQEFCRFIEVYC